MNSVSNRVPVNYTSANVGIITPPDRIARYGGLSDSDMERDFLQMNADINKRKKHVSFEDRKDTPVLVKIILGCAGLFALWKGGKHLIKK